MYVFHILFGYVHIILSLCNINVHCFYGRKKINILIIINIISQMSCLHEQEHNVNYSLHIVTNPVNILCPSHGTHSPVDTNIDKSTPTLTLEKTKQAKQIPVMSDY